MPTYEYTCKTCGETLEVFQSFTDKPLKTHKGCGGELKKVFHARGIVFKGSGFYATDAKGSSSTTNSTDSSSKSDSSSKTEAKPTKKPEKKATPASTD